MATTIITTRTIDLAGASVMPASLEAGPDDPSGEEAPRNRADPQQSRPRVGGQDGADLAHQHGLGLEHLAAALDQPLALLMGVDVLHGPAVGAGLVALAPVVHHPPEQPGA